MLFFIVDDETDIRDFYSETVELCGHTVMDTAANGAEAIEKISRLPCPPDAVILDHRMPVMSGLDAARKLLRLDPSLHIILASADQSAIDQASDLRLHSCLKKPFSVERLIQTIQELEKKE